MGHAHVRETRTFQDLETALQALFAAFRTKQWDEARRAIAVGRTIHGAPSAIFDTYESRIAHYELEPPPEHWDGAWSAKEK
jgi:adenylate cyclase